MTGWGNHDDFRMVFEGNDGFLAFLPTVLIRLGLGAVFPLTPAISLPFCLHPFVSLSPYMFEVIFLLSVSSFLAMFLSGNSRMP